MKIPLRNLALTALLAACAAHSSAATIIISNIPATLSQSNVTGVRSVGYGILMGSDNYNLTSSYYDVTETNLTYNLSIYTDNAGLPGTLHAVTFPSFSNVNVLPTFAPSTPFMLQANTAYWFVLSASATFTAEGSNFPITASGPGASSIGYNYSATGSVPNLSFNGTARPSFRIEGVSLGPPAPEVPEPGSGSLFLLAGAGVWLLRRRRTVCG